MLLILPLATFLLFFQILRKRETDWRCAFLGAAVFWGTSVAIITEALSVPNQLGWGPVSILWSMICIAAACYLKIARRSEQQQSGDPIMPGESLDRPAKLLLAGAGVTVLLVAITAVLSPPNVWDAMEYHLPRVVMWISNHSVRFYPTPDYSQLIFGPWAEFAMMHLAMLWGGDRFVNMVELFSLFGSIIGASVLAKFLGAGKRGQVFSAVIAATIPEGILEASGPMNTYVVSFWILATVVFLLSFNRKPSAFYAICAGLSAGLALLTKGSAYAFLPFLVIACWWMGSRAVRLRLLRYGPIIAGLVILLNAPQAIRCFELTGSPLGLPFRDAGPNLVWRVDRISPSGTLANVVRNVSLHLGTPIQSINDKTEHLVRSAIQELGVNPDDAGQIWPGEGFHIHHFSLHEIHAGNPLHLLILLLSLIVVIYRLRTNDRRDAFWLALGIVGGLVLFSGLLRWQTWGSRHQLPLFIASSAIAGYVLEKYFSRRAAAACVTVLLAVSLPFALLNRTRSLIPWPGGDDVYHARSLQYFNDQHQAIAASEIAAANAVNKLACDSVAIDSHMDRPSSAIVNSPESFYVYPLLAMIHADGNSRRVWYTDVHNWSKRFHSSEPHRSPCAIVCLDCARSQTKWAKYRETGTQGTAFGNIIVFERSGTQENIRSAGIPSPLPTIQ